MTTSQSQGRLLSILPSNATNQVSHKPHLSSSHHPLRHSLTHMGKLAIYQILTLVPLFLLLVKEISTATTGFVPIDMVKFEIDVASGTPRRVLAPFQLCLQCRCCAANDPSNCLSMPCCFGIDCDLPNKPYGVCAFVPKSCNCTSCA